MPQDIKVLFLLLIVVLIVMVVMQNQSKCVNEEQRPRRAENFVINSELCPSLILAI